jgi:phosphomannomutase
VVIKSDAWQPTATRTASVVDGDGTWIQPNLVLALVYDYLVDTRKWNMPAARSVATTQMIDAAARSHGQTVHQTPVGFKYIGQLIREDKIALGGEESAGLTIRGHIPEKDGILACLLVAEMLAARGFHRRTGSDDVQEARARILAGAREPAPLRRTKGKCSKESGRGRFDTNRQESRIHRPHGWRKICI